MQKIIAKSFSKVLASSYRSKNPRERFQFLVIRLNENAAILG